MLCNHFKNATKSKGLSAFLFDDFAENPANDGQENKLIIALT